MTSTNPREVAIKAVAAIIDRNKYEPWTVDRAEQMATEILSTLQPAVSEEAVEAAVKAIQRVKWDAVADYMQGKRRDITGQHAVEARAALTAALPFMMGEKARG